MDVVVPLSHIHSGFLWAVRAQHFLVSWWSNGWSLYVSRHCHLCVTFYDLYAVIAIVLCCLLRMPASTLHTKSTLFNFYLTKAIPTIFCSPGIPVILASRLKPYFCLEFASSENWWRWSHLKRMVPQSKELWIFFLWLTLIDCSC